MCIWHLLTNRFYQVLWPLFSYLPFLFFLQFEELSHHFNRSLYISCSIWVELISDFHFFETTSSGTRAKYSLHGHLFVMAILFYLCSHKQKKRCQQKLQCYYIILFMQGLLHFYESNSITGQGNINACILLMQFGVWDDPALDYYNSPFFLLITTYFVFNKNAAICGNWIHCYVLWFAFLGDLGNGYAIRVTDFEEKKRRGGIFYSLLWDF